MMADTLTKALLRPQHIILTEMIDGSVSEELKSSVYGILRQEGVLGLVIQR